MGKDKIREKPNKENKQHKKTIEVNIGFTVFKIVAILLIMSLLTAKTVMTIIETKENVSYAGQKRISLLAEIDIGYTLSDNETYVTVTITSDYAITQIEVSEEDYDENLEEDDYTFTIEEDWEEADNGLVWSKEFTENIDKLYRLTFEDETSVIKEITITDILDSEEQFNKDGINIDELDENDINITGEIIETKLGNGGEDSGLMTINDTPEFYEEFWIYFYSTYTDSMWAYTYDTYTATDAGGVVVARGYTFNGFTYAGQISYSVDVYEGTSSSDATLTDSGSVSYKEDAADGAYFLWYLCPEGIYICTANTEDHYDYITTNYTYASEVEEYIGNNSSDFPLVAEASASDYIAYYIDIDVYYDPITYYIAYDANGGTGEMETTEMKYMVAARLTKNAFEKTGYTFDGWGTTSDATERTYSNRATVYNLTTTDGEVITLYALWEANRYYINYEANGGEGSMDWVEATYDTALSLSSNTFTRTGYVFAGWNTVPDGSGTAYTNEETVINLTDEDYGDVYLYAQWEPISYTISFDGNGADGGDTESITANYDEEYTLTSNGFTKKSYKFTSWNTEADGSGTSYTDGATVSNLTSTDGATITLYAQWEINTVSITITKVASDGTTTLAGAEFSLYELVCEDSSHDHDSDDDLIDTENYDTTCWELFGTYTSDSDGTFILNDVIQSSVYRLVETKTVDGYLLPSGQWKIQFEDLDEDKAVTVGDVTFQITGIANPPAMTAGDDTIYLYNNSSYDLPSTGNVGKIQIMATGTIIIAIGIIDIMTKKRRKIASLRNSVSDARKIIKNYDQIKTLKNKKDNQGKK